MKIMLNLDKIGMVDRGDRYDLMRTLKAASEGDFMAKNAIFDQYLPLMFKLAKKRACDSAQVNQLIEAGKQGLMQAICHYKEGEPPEKFKLKALNAIELAMEGRPKGWLARLMGR